LDAWVRAKAANRQVIVHSLEPNPLSWEDVEPLGHAALAQVPEEVVKNIVAGRHVDGHLDFTRIDAGVMAAALEEEWADVVYFDAFAPAAQPEMWSVPVMDRMRWALKPGGQLVTYCAKGDVRRTMEEAGFQVDRIPGPPGKREMLRATKVARPQGRFNVRAYMVVVQDGRVLVSYERLPMGGVMKFPGGGVEWGEGPVAAIRREALEELGQSVTVNALLHVSRKAHISSFDDNQQVLAIHHLTQLDGPVRFEDEGTLEDVFGKGVPMMDQKLGWREVDTLQPQDFHFASDREAWGAWLARRAAKR
jgi:ADP-ribose pyrophosphatase YjhB (NUDIX family)